MPLPSPEVLEELEAILSLLREKYFSISPDAHKVEAFLMGRGDEIVHDHFAIRTLAISPINLDSLEPVFTSRGYQSTGSYLFHGKAIRARSYSHPLDAFPRIFLSELDVNTLSPKSQDILHQAVESLDEEVTGETILGADRNWPPLAKEDYEHLTQESEYAAWVASMGVRVNHFALSANEIGTLDSIEDIAHAIEELGIEMNRYGGLVKGERQDLLVQCSTMASHISVAFQHAVVHKIPGGYVEFARRYRDPNTQHLFDGFVIPNADSIFESTNRKGIS